MRRPVRQLGRSGSSLIETALIFPILILLLIGTVEMARITYTYYQLQKVMAAFARYVGTQQAVNLCDANDAQFQQAVTLALTGGIDTGGQPVVLGLQSSDFQVQVERYNATNDALEICDCSGNGCDVTQGGTAPQFLSVYLANGYPVQLRIPFVLNDPILLRPSVRMPFGGT